MAMSAAVLLTGCGGGAGSGGGGSRTPGSEEGVLLTEISFPESSDLTGATTTPPRSAPLGQQVIFTFSDVPDCPDEVIVDLIYVGGFIKIYALIPSNYSGPELVVDRSNNTIPARGIFERIGNLVVFTPFLPTAPLDLSSNATRDAIPGLLPDLEYIVYVPISASGVIRNLTGVAPSVSNPISFTTCCTEHVSLYYQNHPADPPRVVASYPRSGDFDVPVNPYSKDLPGFPAQEEFFLSFDQPLLFSKANIEGRDLDDDGIDEENMLLRYIEPVYFAALEHDAVLDPALLRIERLSGRVEIVGFTRLQDPPSNIALNSIVSSGTGQMLGTDGAVLYAIDYKNVNGLDQECRLTAIGDFGSETVDLRGLCFGPDGTLYALRSEAAGGLSKEAPVDLVAVNPRTSALTFIYRLGTTEDDYDDLAAGIDGKLYALVVKDRGTSYVSSTIDEIDLGIESVRVTTLLVASEDYSSISMLDFDRIALYSSRGLFVDRFDRLLGQIVSTERCFLKGSLEDGALLNIDISLAELGTWADLVDNTFDGSKVVLTPSGILPFGAKVELLVRRGLENISAGSVAGETGRHPAQSDLIATFTTFDPGSAPVGDIFLEDFLNTEWEGAAITEGLPPAIWNVDDVNGEPPLYEHLLASYGLGGDGALGDFRPTGIASTILLDTDYQILPLLDSSTPGVKRTTIVKGGVFNFTSISIPEGVTVVGFGSNPLVLKATGTITIAGTIDVSGLNGMDDVTFDSAFVPTPGGLGGPGGGRGGVGQPTVPEYFQTLTQLRSPQGGEDGFGYSNLVQNGGRGGESGAVGTSVKYQDSANGGDDPDSRGAGGGGGSFLQEGGFGYLGRGAWGANPDDPARYFFRDAWWFDNGNPNPIPSVDQYMTTHPRGGDPGDRPFSDGDDQNDFIGIGGEVPFLRGGQGGGGGGSRLDSMNPATIALGAGTLPLPLDRSAFDAKGGGGGGGGGALGLYALGDIVIESTGVILARGGYGGGGEVIGYSDYGGGAGGGSGGAVIIDSGMEIAVRAGAIIDLSGGWPGDAREVVKSTAKGFTRNFCINNKSPHKHYASFCCWAPGDGGYGGFGIVQLQASALEKIHIDDPHAIYAEACQVDWTGPICDGQDYHCGCPKEPGKVCAHMYHHFKIHYDVSNNPSIPITHDCLVDPRKTPTTLGPVSYGLSRWIDLGQVIHRGPIGGLPAPVFVGFAGTDLVTGTVMTQNGYIPNPEDLDIEVYAPDYNNGMVHYIPEDNEVVVEFQATDAVAPGSKVPDIDLATLSEWTADIHSLSGRQFIRFRVRLDTAKGSQPTIDSTKPQVNFVRLRLLY